MGDQLLLKILRSLAIIALCSALFSCGEFTGWKDDDSADIGSATKVELHLSESNLYKLYETVSIDESVPCSVSMGDWYGNGTLKVRGYTSRMHAKKSFMLKIDGKKYILERGHLTGGIGNRIAMRTYQLAGLPACDTETIGLFLNEEYLGCYNLITYYDEDTLDGELYKIFFDDYEHMENNHPLSSLSEKKFPDDSDMSNLEYLIAALTTEDDGRWSNFVNKNVDIEKFASYLAVHDFLMVEDTFSTNYYICYDGRYYFLPWDNEQCLGSPFSKYELGGDNQLVRRLVSVPQVKDAYNRKMKELFLDDGEDNILPELRIEAEEMLADASGAVKSDPNYKNEFDDFIIYENSVRYFLSEKGRCTALPDPVLK